MFHSYTFVARLAWAVVGVFWVYSALKVKDAVYRQPRKDRLVHIAQLTLAFTLLFAENLYVSPFSMQLIPRTGLAGDVAGIFGDALTVIGVFYMIWARVHLAGNWSATVTLKQGHELVTSGPYQFTRHPIYTGFVAAFVGSALTVGELRAFLAVVIVIYSFSIKMKDEETLMTRQFPQAYEDYRKRVKRLIPFIY